MEGKIMMSGQMSGNDTAYTADCLRKSCDPARGHYIKERPDGQVELCATLNVKACMRYHRRRNRIDTIREFDDLKKFSKIRLRKKRAKKKFKKRFVRYVSGDIAAKWMGVCFSRLVARPLNYQSIGRKLFMVEEIPEGAYARYKDEVEVLRLTIKGDPSMPPNNGGDKF